MSRDLQRDRVPSPWTLALLLCTACGPQHGPTIGNGGDAASSGTSGTDSLSGSGTTGSFSPDIGAPQRVVRLTLLATIRGTVPGQGLGVQVEFGGDHNGDGLEDLLVGQAGGQAYVFYGGAFVAETVQPPDEPVQAGKTLRLPGYVNYASAGDFDGDGRPDVVLVAPRMDQWDLHRLYVVHSDPGDTIVDVTDDPAKVGLVSGDATNSDIGPPKDEYYAQTLSYADVNRDGLDDLIATTYQEIYIVLGVARGQTPATLDTASLGIGGKHIRGKLGAAVVGLPLDADGEAGHIAAAGETIVYILPDDLPTGSSCYEGVGTCGPEFATGTYDGFPLAYHASVEPSLRRLAMGSSAFHPSTAVRMFPDLDGFSEQDGSPTAFAGSRPAWSPPDASPDYWLGTALAFVGDLDDDGIPDLAMSSENPSTVIVALSPPDGTNSNLDEALLAGDAAQVYGTQGDDFGWQLAAGRDVTGDGVADLVVGAPGDGDGSAPGGAVYIYGITYQ
ncbi:MAG: VCBS repeat-containing protein [Nannocystaceae bacterium]